MGTMLEELQKLGLASKDIKAPESKQQDYSQFVPSDNEDRRGGNRQKGNNRGKGSSGGGYNAGKKSGGYNSGKQGGGYGSTKTSGGYGGGGYGGKGGSNTTTRPAVIGSSRAYVGAPYNFIPISSDVLNYEKQHGEIPAQNSNAPELLSGYIDYEVEALQPICIGGVTEEKGEMKKLYFYRDANGEFAIPGNTMRGLVRSNAQLLSRSYLGDDIDDVKLMYREVAGGALRRIYSETLGTVIVQMNGSTISVLQNVKGGYIANENGKYVIYGTKNDKAAAAARKENYFILSERFVHEKPNGFEYLYSDKLKNKLQYKPGTTFNQVMRGGSEHYVTARYNVNASYKPFHEPVSYTVSNTGRVTGIGNPNAKNATKKGELVGTGFMNEKKALYVIDEIDRDNLVIEISALDVESYNIDLNAKETIFKGNKTYDFYKLPDRGETRPVFYISLGGRLYFGYTPRLRLFFAHSVKEGIRQKKTTMDYARAMFGYAGKDDARKTRVSFEDAPVEQVNAKTKDEAYILAAPKPTSYFDYVEQGRVGNPVRTYNDNGFAIRGVKQYWNKKKVESASLGNNDRVASKFEVLPKKTKFNGCIRFNNLHEDELGLLLWSLELGEGCVQNIGHAKPYGFGSVRIRVKGVRSFNGAQAYAAEAFLFDPYEDITGRKKEYVEAARKIMAVNNSSANTLLDMKGTVIDNERHPDLVRYMRLGSQGETREYQERKRANAVLPTVAEVIRKNT